MCKVIIGTTVVRNSAYILDKFLKNQKDIQNNFAGTELVIATEEIKFVDELQSRFEKYKLKGEVLHYETYKPDYAKDRNWSIAAGREKCREYAVNNGSDFLLIVDSDMIYNNSLIQILLAVSNGYDIIQSGYRSKHNSRIGFGGCNLIGKDSLKKTRFRCVEFKNGQIIEEGNMFEYDTFRKGARIKKGIFVGIEHYRNTEEKLDIKPQKLSARKKLIISPFIRFVIVGFSLCIKYDISSKIQRFFVERKKNE